MKKKCKSILIIVNLFILLLLYLINSKLVIASFLEYSKLFLTKLFPVSFIFFMISSLLIDYGLIEIINRYLKINSSSLYIFFISMISGFPSGAKYTKELLELKKIDIRTGNRCLMFSHFPNPLFVMGSINLILNDSVLAIKILLAILISNLIIFIFFKDRNKKNHTSNFKLPDDFSEELNKVIINSFKTLLIIYGTSIFFYLIVTIITRYINTSTYSYILINGIFDLCKGVFSTSLIANDIVKCYFILFFISIGGVSIHMQVMGIISKSSLKYGYFFIGRVIGCILSFIIFSLLLSFS